MYEGGFLEHYTSSNKSDTLALQAKTHIASRQWSCGPSSLRMAVSGNIDGPPEGVIVHPRIDLRRRNLPMPQRPQDYITKRPAKLSRRAWQGKTGITEVVA